MGVPRLFRLLAERYPLILRDCDVTSPEFDHLYLDFNGLRQDKRKKKEARGMMDRRKRKYGKKIG